MAIKSPRWQPTPRDIDILATLDLLPLTPEQLLKWSLRFDQPFTEIGALRRRLRQLAGVGLVGRWPMAIATRGSVPYYYKLTPRGYRLLRSDEDAQPSRRRAFAPIGPARHHHTKCLSDFIVHTATAAHRSGVVFADLHPENAFRVELHSESLWLDWRFAFVRGASRRIYNVELDCSTESVLSPRDADSIGRKIRLLDEDQSRYAAVDSRRPITLFVTTRSRRRMEHILDAAAIILRNPYRSVIYGVYLPDFLALDHPLVAPCFLDHRGRQAALLPQAPVPQTPPPIPSVALTASACYAGKS
jgi:hypothetical protein